LRYVSAAKRNEQQEARKRAKAEIVQQLLATWRRAKGKERDALLWGDEIEYLVVTYDDDKREVRLSLRQADILEALASDEKLLAQGGGVEEIHRGSVRYDDVDEMNVTSTHCIHQQVWQDGACFPPRVWPLHARNHAWTPLGHRPQRPAGR
jgi:hypothetical protein